MFYLVSYCRCLFKADVQVYWWYLPTGGVGLVNKAACVTHDVDNVGGARQLIEGLIAIT